MSAEISRRTAIEAAAALAAPIVAGAALPSEAAAATPDGRPVPAGGAARPTPSAGASQEPAHYYRFQEIVEGRELVRRSGHWRFEGRPIRLDPAGVHRMVDDPDTTRLPEGSAARRASESCDRAYAEVLAALQRVFDGYPEELGRAVALMHRLARHADALARIPDPAGGGVLGPAFQVPDDGA